MSLEKKIRLKKEKKTAWVKGKNQFGEKRKHFQVKREKIKKFQSLKKIKIKFDIFLRQGVKKRRKVGEGNVLVERENKNWEREKKIMNFIFWVQLYLSFWVESELFLL